MVITLKDVYNELRTLHDQVAAMTPQTRTVSDHEVRLRRVERWMYALPASLLLAAGSLFVAIHH